MQGILKLRVCQVFLLAICIISEQYDCGITDVFSDHPAVECQRIPMKTVCIMSEGNALGKKKFITPEDLINEPMIHSRRDSAFY
jgi:hypothetical protein